jgi:hypothetical protein
MMMQIDGHYAQGEALLKFGKSCLNALQVKASFDARASNTLVAIQTGSER